MDNVAISIKQDVPIVPSQSTDNIQQHADKKWNTIQTRQQPTPKIRHIFWDRDLLLKQHAHKIQNSVPFL